MVPPCILNRSKRCRVTIFGGQGMGLDSKRIGKKSGLDNKMDMDKSRCLLVRIGKILSLTPLDNRVDMDKRKWLLVRIGNNLTLIPSTIRQAAHLV